MLTQRLAYEVPKNGNGVIRFISPLEPSMRKGETELSPTAIPLANRRSGSKRHWQSVTARMEQELIVIKSVRM